MSLGACAGSRSVTTVDDRLARRDTLCMSPLQRRVILTLVVALHLIGDLAAVPVIHRWKLGDGSGFAWGLLFGIVVGQLSILAAWWAWGPGHWLDRTFKTGFLAVLVWFALAVGAESTGDSFEVSSIEQLSALVIGVSFPSLFIAHWVVRAFDRRRISLAENGGMQEVAFGPRFRVAHLLTWMTAVAVLCAIVQSPIGRELWTGQRSKSANELSIVATLLVLWAGLCAMMSIPTVWLCLGRGEASGTRRLLPYLIHTVAVVTLCLAIAATIAGGVLIVIAAGVPLGMIGEVVACGLVLRACGYRLVKIGGSGY